MKQADLRVLAEGGFKVSVILTDLTNPLTDLYSVIEIKYKVHPYKDFPRLVTALIGFFYG